MLRVSLRQPLLLALLAYLLAPSLLPHVFAASNVTFQPTKIALSEPEIVNPQRGFIKWGGGSETIPPVEPSKDWTTRVNWSDIEKSEGVYDWTVTDRFVSQAASEGRRMSLGFRDMRSAGIHFPAYLRPYSWTTVNAETGDEIVVPDYNSPVYQARMRAFLKAAGERYDGKLAFADIRMFGKWGEWHLYGIDYALAPSGITPATQASKRAIIDAHIAAFPKTQLVMLIADSYALKYSLMDVSPTYPIGWRADSFGKGTYVQNALAKRLDDYPGLEAAFNERWKTAPVIAELYGTDVTAESLLPQVPLYHVNVIGNGNFGDAWDIATSAQRDMFREAGKRSGYRYVIHQTTADTATAGKLNLTTQWLNEGVSPTYEPWQARWQLRNPTTGAVVWEGVSQTNFKTLLPTNGTPVTVSDSFTLPSTVAQGTYRLTLLVTDPRNVRKPMRLAINGKQADNSYLLGDVTVSAGTTTPQPTPAPATAQPFPILVRASSIGSTNDGSALSIDTPANTSLGDVLVAQITIRDSDTAVTAPSGWQQVRADAVSGTMKQLVYVKVASATEPARYTWQYTSPQHTSGTSDAAGGLVAYINVDRANPIEAHSGQANEPSSTITAPSLSTAKPGNLLVFLGSTAWRGAAITAPQGMSQRFSQRAETVGVSALGTDQALTTGGATGSRVAQAAVTDYTIGQLVALRPVTSLAPDLVKAQRYLPLMSAPTR